MKLHVMLRGILALVALSLATPVTGHAQWVVAAPNIFTAAATPFVGLGFNLPQDRLHIHTVNPNQPFAVARISTDFAGCFGTSQIAMEPDIGATVFSSIATPGDMVIRTIDSPNMGLIGTCAEDVIVSAQTFGGAIRFSTLTSTTAANDTEKMTIISNGFTGIGTMLPGGTGNPQYRLEVQNGDLGITDLAHRRTKIRLFRDGIPGNIFNAGHAIGTEQGFNTYGPAQNYCGATIASIGHKFYNDCNIVVATIGQGGFGLPLSQKMLSRFFGNLQLDGAFMPGGDPGVAGELLVSAGPGAPPVWQAPAAAIGSAAWLLSGNAGTNAATDFLGTTDNVDFSIRTNNVQRIRVESNGFVGIGDPSPTTTLSVGTNDANGRINIGSAEFIRDAGANHLMLGAATTVTPSADCGPQLGSATLRWEAVFACNGMINTSDLRQKDNIKDLSYGLAEIMKLRPVSFTWKNKQEDGTKLGVIAQEVQKVLPEVVNDPANELRYDEDGRLIPNDPNTPLGVYYSDIIPVLIKAVQEQQAVIADNTAEISELKERVADLESRLATTPGNISVPSQYEDILLEQNNPNPFSESTNIMYFIPSNVAGTVEIVVADAGGSNVLQRYPATVNAPQQITLSAKGLDTGVYVYGVSVNGRIVVSKKMMIMK